MKKANAKEWVWVGVVMLLSLFWHLAMWRLGYLGYDVVAGVMFTVGVMVGEGVKYQLWEPIVAVFVWPVNFVYGVIEYVGR